MRVLFLHQNFPGQFLHVARALKERGHKVAAVTDAGNTRPDVIPTLRYRFEDARAGNPHPLARNFALRAARGEVVVKALCRLRDDGFVPDVVVGHPGWGETLFVKDVFPKARLLVHAEFYYGGEVSDADFDPEFRRADPLAGRLTVRAKNAALLLAVMDADRGVAPTGFQASRFPAEIRPKIAVIHEGVDTDLLVPNPQARFEAGGRTFRPGDEVLTFINRNLEPYRGYHVFMRALPRILEARPNAHAVIVGGDSVSYGAPAPEGKTWKEIFLAEVRDRLPLERVHFVGRIPYPDFVSLMQTSMAHVYLTYPFVLSWSMLEAMSAGALVIGSRTEPVEEVIRDGENGLLVDFFDQDALVACAVEALAHPERFRDVRHAARRSIVEGYDLRRRCLPQWLKFVVRGE